MAAVFRYRVVEPIDWGDWVDIRAAAAEDVRCYEYWGESLSLNGDHAFPGGFTKVTCAIDDEALDLAMGLLDIQHMIRWLAIISHQYRCNWELSLGGTVVGMLEHGVIPNGLMASIEERLGYTLNQGPRVIDRAQALQQHANR